LGGDYVAVDFKDNSKQVLSQMEKNIKKALTKMGEVGLEMVIDTMNTGYSKRIWQTGTLQRDQTFRINEDEQSTTWGVLKGDPSAPYAAYVHEGTARMSARPFLKDGILEHKQELIETAESVIKDGFG
jgi:HK97 gp10 family phage protein